MEMGLEFIILVIIIWIIIYFTEKKKGDNKHFGSTYRSKSYINGSYAYQRPSQKPKYEINDDLSQRTGSEPIVTKVVGVTYENRQDIIRRMNVGEDLKLVAEHDNIYDKNAIKVLRSNGDQIGYLNKDLAARIKLHFSSVQAFLHAEVLDIIGNSFKDQNLGIVIKFYSPAQEKAQLLKPESSDSSVRFEKSVPQTQEKYPIYKPDPNKLSLPTFIWDTRTAIEWYFRFFSATDREIANGMCDEEARFERFKVSRIKSHESAPKSIYHKNIDEVDWREEYKYLKSKYEAFIREEHDCQKH